MVTRRPFLVLALAVVVLTLVTGWARGGRGAATPSSAGLTDAEGTAQLAAAAEGRVTGAGVSTVAAARPGTDRISPAHVRPAEAVDGPVPGGATPAARADRLDTRPQPMADTHRSSTEPSHADGMAFPADAHADDPATTTADARHSDALHCVVRADCGGALVLGGLVLALAIPAMAPTIGGLAPVALVVNPAPRWHPTLRSGRLFRPPRFS